MFAQELLEPFRDDMAAISDYQFGEHLRLLCAALGEGIDDGIEVFDGNAGNSAVARMLRQPGEMLIELFAYLSFEEIYQIHLPHDHHAPGIAVEAGDEVVVSLVIDVQSLITLDDAHLRQLLGGEAEERLRNRDVDVHRSLAMMVQLEQSLIDEAVAVPAVFVGMDFGQIDGAFHQRTEDAGLRKGLPVHLSNPSCRAVGGNHYQRDLLVVSLSDGGVDIQ